jgi:hypothetical protein
MATNLEALRRIAGATDFQAVKVFEEFTARLNEAIADREGIINGLPEGIRTIDGEAVVDLLNQKADQELSETESIRMARRLLTLAADDETLSSLIVESFDGWRDDLQAVELILAIGAIGTVWMVVASTDVKIKCKGLTVSKSAANADQLHALADLVRAMLGLPRVPPGSGKS